MGAVADLVAELETNQSTLSNSVHEQSSVVTEIASAAAAGADGVSQIGDFIRRLEDDAKRLDLAR